MKAMLVRPKDDPRGLRVCKVVRGKGVDYEKGITLRKEENLLAIADIIYPSYSYYQAYKTKPEETMESVKNLLNIYIGIAFQIDKAYLKEGNAHV